jgi:hypothetical protein
MDVTDIIDCMSEVEKTYALEYLMKDAPIEVIVETINVQVESVSDRIEIVQRINIGKG